MSKENDLGSWAQGLITDGFKQRFFIAAAPGLYPELRGVFTPMLPDAVNVADDEIQKSEPDRLATTLAKYLSAHVHEWSFTEGRPTAQHFRRMRPGQLNKLYRIVSGKIPTDLDIEPGKLEDRPEPLEPMGK